MPVLLERRTRLPPDATSPARARRMLQAGLEEAGLDDLVDTAVLLASELCENAVLHAGTDFEIELTVTPDDVTIAVTDHGPGPLELHLAMPRTGRAATHGRGLQMIERLAGAWGTRHEANGRHQTWFTLLRDGDDEAEHESEVPLSPPGRDWPSVQTARWLLRVPSRLAARLDLSALVAELLRRLCDVLEADGAAVWVDYGDGRRMRELARHGHLADGASVVRVQLPMPAPLRGQLDVSGPGAEQSATAAEVAELCAQRIALAVESDWLRGADQRRRAWMTYLAETSELLAQSLDVDLTVAVIPQLVVPRLGRWCAVHLADERGRLRLAALTHADEDAIPALRSGLDTTRPGPLPARLATALRRPGRPVGLGSPLDGIAVALTARGQRLGTLGVGRPVDRSHSPEDIALVSDLARRASLAIDNAQTTALHIRTSQALQEALLPRELPAAQDVEFAAEYLPASTGADVGGDFYDVLALDDGNWLMSIGDVCGKGVRAAARTGLVRDVLRVLVNDGRTPQRAVELLNEVMMEARDPQQFCTLAAALISRSENAQLAGLGVELVLAGHERPVLVRADGRVGFIGEHGTAVGLVPNVRPRCTRHWLHPGDALVTYTDGVTERRRRGELFGEDRLLRALEPAAGGSAADLVDAVRSAIETYSADPRRDDLAVLAVRAAPRQVVSA